MRAPEEPLREKWMPLLEKVKEIWDGLDYAFGRIAELEEWLVHPVEAGEVWDIIEWGEELVKLANTLAKRAAQMVRLAKKVEELWEKEWEVVMRGG